MCRIAGMLSGRLAPIEMRQKVAAMCTAMQHGGPDDEGIFYDDVNKVVLGHRRLAVIDLSSNGHQPMADVATKVWITFNGEIYNYPELKTELLHRGAKFKSDTDTEVIVAAYLQWGTEAFAKLRGMFAFALYDVRHALVYLVRDTVGIKPLYYHTDGFGLNFASEVKAFKHAAITTGTDPDWMIRFLAFGHVPEPYTTLKNVFSLQKGYFLCWNNRNNSYEIKPYGIKNDHYLINSRASACENIRTGLNSAIKRQLLSDAPIGVFLSGGVDSSLITLLANEEKQDALKTISIFFDEKDYDERMFQQIVLNQISGENFSHLVTLKEFQHLFPKIIGDMDMPTTDGINTWFISKYAHESGLKAVLSGLGADELFGGYPSFSRIRYLKMLRYAPSSLFKNAGSVTADRYKKISFLSNNHLFADYLFLRGLFSATDISKILDTDTSQVNDVLFHGSPFRLSGKYDKEQAGWFEENIYMQNQLLRDTDVMSMSHGLEVRVPFLDEDFQKIAKAISPSIRFSAHPAKKILIDSFAGVLPESVWNRRKMGFSFPLQQWMQDIGPISDENLYQNKYAKKVINQFKAGKTHWSKAFALYHIQTNG
jgi:asparagine synthase (glutamine-hydrolysing)